MVRHKVCKDDNLLNKHEEGVNHYMFCPRTSEFLGGLC